MILCLFKHKWKPTYGLEMVCVRCGKNRAQVVSFGNKYEEEKK